MPPRLSPGIDHAGAASDDVRPEPRVSVIIPTYRDFELVREAVPRVLQSTGVSVDVVIVNNDPAQGVARWVAESGFEGVRAIEVGRNAGFMGAINRGIAATTGEYILFHNADLVVSPAYLAELAALMRERPRAGVASGKVLRYDLATRTATGVIDTAGIAMRRNRGAFDRGEGRPDRSQFDTAEEVFAVSGAALFAAREALEDVRCRGEYLHEQLFMYKDDIDLGWRMRLRGWECWYVPAAVAYHARTSRGLAGRRYRGSIRAYLRNERRKPRSIRLHSMKNQWIVLLRNETAGGFLRAAPWIAGREALVLGANLVTSPRMTAEALLAFARALPAAWRTRRTIQHRRLADSREIERWMR